jgi:hypothetical protein
VPRAFERRLGELDADRLGPRVAQRGEEPPGSAAEVEHPFAGLRLGQQQRAPALPLPRLRVVRRLRPQLFVVSAHRGIVFLPGCAFA